MPEEVKKSKKEKPKSLEEQKKEIAKTYNINLSDIEHVQLENGKEFFKFYNSKTREVKMIENRDYNNGLSTQFKSIQQELSFTQGRDDKNNANAIFDYNMDHKNVELPLIPMQELKSNRFKYVRQIRALSTIDRKKVKALIKSARQLGLKYINLENAIGIDDNNNVIDVVYDFMTNTAVIKNAKVLNYQDQKENVDTEDINIEITDEEFNIAVENIEVNEEGPILKENGTLNLRGESIDNKTIRDCYQMPEAIDKLNVSNKRRFIIRGIIKAIERRMAIIKKPESKEKEKVRVLTKKKDNKAA